MLMRFRTRAGQHKDESGKCGSRKYGIWTSFYDQCYPSQNMGSNYHQLDKIIIQVNETEDLTSSTEIISRMLFRRHQEVKDFEITVPELLLKQEQRTKDIFNIVLGAIAVFLCW